MKRILRRFMVGNVPTNIEKSPTLNRNPFNLNIQRMNSAPLIDYFERLVSNFATQPKLFRVEKLTLQQIVNFFQCKDFFMRKTKNRHNIGTDINKAAIIIRQENGIGKIAQYVTAKTFDVLRSVHT